jgi:hypothetical protein
MKQKQFISIATASFAQTVERSKPIYGLQKCREDYFLLLIDT